VRTIRLIPTFILRLTLLSLLAVVVIRSFDGDFSDASTSYHVGGITSFFNHYSNSTDGFLAQGKDPFVPYVNIRFGRFRLLYAAKSSDYQWLASVPWSWPVVIIFIAAAGILFRSLRRPLQAKPLTNSPYSRAFVFACVSVLVSNVIFRVLIVGLLSGIRATNPVIDSAIIAAPYLFVSGIVGLLLARQMTTHFKAQALMFWIAISVLSPLSIDSFDLFSFGGLMVVSVAALILSPVLLVFLFAYKRLRLPQLRRDRGLCPICSYDLRASTDRCPECGTPIPEPAASLTQAIAIKS
jgi:hypothetical protein